MDVPVGVCTGLPPGSISSQHTPHRTIQLESSGRMESDTGVSQVSAFHFISFSPHVLTVPRYLPRDSLGLRG